MREEDDMERSGGRDREKLSGYTEGEGTRTTKKRDVGGTLRGSRSARARRKRGGGRGGRSSEERGEMGYVAMERERRQGVGEEAR